ncbi:hypothetical protein [Rodentibacter pneumotropicus]|uniref:hypothetical protein n=1 Tax=Rodentibacter pneumotropicus TaxID=758 RepID=UPI0015C35E7F|nr:hypothetical protein [Rodentibacter pneumotropicus]
MARKNWMGACVVGLWWFLMGIYAKNENGGDWLKMGGNWVLFCIKIVDELVIFKQF